METMIFDRIKEIKKDKELLEKKLNISLKIKGKSVIFEGNPMEEYEARIVLDAINFGYPASTALLLKDEDFMFNRLNIKDFTKRKDLSTIKGRIIGTKGKTKRTIENISNCKIILKGNEIGIICAADEMDDTITALANLIRGSKQSNVYKFLEKKNAQRKILNKK